MVIGNVLESNIVKRKMFMEKWNTIRVVHAASVISGGRQPEGFSLHQFKFQFSYHGVEVPRHHFPIRLAFAKTVHNGQGQTLTQVTVDLRFTFFHLYSSTGPYLASDKSQDALLFYEQEYTPAIVAPTYIMQVPVSN